MGDHPQPGFLEQVLRHVATPAEPREEVEQRRVEFRVDLVEGIAVALFQPGDQRQLAGPIDRCHNASNAQA